MKPAATDHENLLEDGPWQARLEAIVSLMREMSSLTDPQEMVRTYIDRLTRLRHTDRRVSLSRRGLSWPEYRVTRYSGWTEEVNPWKDGDRLPVLSGGVLAQLIYSNRADFIANLELDPNDPAREFLDGQKSLLSLPHFDGGEAINMTVLTREQPDAFVAEQFPEMVWMASLFGRATQNLVLADRLNAAYREIDDEFRTVADLQRSLLPKSLPELPGASFAASYRTSRRAGGDYYDFFPIDEHRVGILIADVSGHGAPAAVIMAVAHSIAHLYDGPPESPGRRLDFLNRQLARRYTGEGGAFVTAFAAVYDSRSRKLAYSSAGHNPPRVKSCSGKVRSLTGAGSIPLGIVEEIEYSEATFQLHPGDEVVFYTDGIVEAMNAEGELFGVERLDERFGACGQSTEETLNAILQAVDAFSGRLTPEDDQTLVLMEVRE